MVIAATYITHGFNNDLIVSVSISLVLVTIMLILALGCVKFGIIVNLRHCTVYGCCIWITYYVIAVREGHFFYHHLRLELLLMVGQNVVLILLLFQSLLFFLSTLFVKVLKNV